MPPEKIAFFSSDEEEDWRPLCSSAIVNRRRRKSDSEMDELESDAEDELVPAPAFVIRTRAQRSQIEESKRRKREPQRKRSASAERKTKKAAQAAPSRKKAREPETSTVPAPVHRPRHRPRPSDAVAQSVPRLPSSWTLRTTLTCLCPSLLVRSSQQKRSKAPSAHPERMSEDEVELIASQSSPQPPAAAVSQERSSSLPILTESSNTKRLPNEPLRPPLGGTTSPAVPQPRASLNRQMRPTSLT